MRYRLVTVVTVIILQVEEILERQTFYRTNAGVWNVEEVEIRLVFC